MKINEVIMREGYELRLERDKRANMLVLHVKDTRTGRRSEVRGKLGYETDGYDPNDKLHQLLDKVGRSASVSDMMNGDVVHINPRHPQGPSAKKAASAITSEKIQEAFDNPYPITWEYLNPTGASSGIVKLDDGSALDIHFSEEPAGVYEIEFARDGSNKQMGRSGQGDEFRVFATVQAAMLKWWKQLDKTSARKITFYANKQDGNRARLYKRFLKMWGDKSGWEIEVNAKSGLAAYSLTNPNPDKPKNGKKTFIQRVFGKKETNVQEAFDNPYPIKWLSLRPDSSSSAKAKLDDGSELEIHFADDDAGYYDIEFLRSGSMKVSGEGDEFRVFATVQAAILEWWKQTDKKYVRAISFSADKGDNNRSKLYKRFAEMWAKKIKWQFKSNDSRRDVEFSLIRPKAVEENFADGKVKGKSRPGRVKKSGASCSGSVTSLRKKAKAGGEKGRMYHWCANMKSGRKKK